MKGGKETVERRLDPQSQAFVNRMRLVARQGADQILAGGPLVLGPDTRPIREQIAPYFNDFIVETVAPVRGEFDRLRALARRATADAATAAGAFGGSRQGVAEAVRLAELDRAQAGTIADLVSRAFDRALAVGLPHIEQTRQLRERALQEPLFRTQAALGLMNLGLGPTGAIQTTETEADPLAQAVGLGLTALSFFPPGAVAAAPAAAAASLPSTAARIGLQDSFRLPPTSIFSPDYRNPFSSFVRF